MVQTQTLLCGSSFLRPGAPNLHLPVCLCAENEESCRRWAGPGKCNTTGHTLSLDNQCCALHPRAPGQIRAGKSDGSNDINPCLPYIVVPSEFISSGIGKGPRPISTQPALNPHTSGYQRFWSGFIESRSRSVLGSGTSRGCATQNMGAIGMEQAKRVKPAQPHQLCPPSRRGGSCLGRLGSPPVGKQLATVAEVPKNPWRAWEISDEFMDPNH